jgi:hypothetical protein
MLLYRILFVSSQYNTFEGMLDQEIDGDLKIDLKLAKPFDMIMEVRESGKLLPWMACSGTVSSSVE